MKVWIVTDHGNQILGVFDNEDSLKWFMNDQERNINWSINEYEMNSNTSRINKVYTMLVNKSTKKVIQINDIYYAYTKNKMIYSLDTVIGVVANSAEEAREKAENYIKGKL